MPDEMVLPAAMPIAVTLKAGEWNHILSILHKTPLPYEISAPLIGQIRDQVMVHAQPQPQAPVDGVAAEAAHVPH